MMLSNKQLGLAPERLAQVVVEVRELVLVWDDVAQVPQLQPLAGEVVHERARARSASMRRTCRSQHGWVLQLPLARHVEQLIVGNAAPEEERQPGRQVQIAQIDTVFRERDIRRLGFDAEYELRAGENRPKRPFDAGVEASPSARPASIEGIKARQLAGVAGRR